VEHENVPFNLLIIWGYMPLVDTPILLRWVRSLFVSDSGKEIVGINKKFFNNLRYGSTDIIISLLIFNYYYYLNPFQHIEL